MDGFLSSFIWVVLLPSLVLVHFVIFDEIRSLTFNLMIQVIRFLWRRESTTTTEWREGSRRKEDSTVPTGREAGFSPYFGGGAFLHPNRNLFKLLEELDSMRAAFVPSFVGVSVLRWAVLPLSSSVGLVLTCPSLFCGCFLSSKKKANRRLDIHIRQPSVAALRFSKR